MASELLLSGFIMAVGLSIAGIGTYFYQWRIGRPAMLRYDGRTYLHSLGHLFMSFICGPLIMLKLGWQHEGEEAVSLGSVLVSALVAFGWAFVTGLFFLGLYLSVVS
jgi:hypothetical protein